LGGNGDRALRTVRRLQAKIEPDVPPDVAVEELCGVEKAPTE